MKEKQTLKAVSEETMVQAVERLSEADKAVLDLAKVKRELAFANAQTAVALKELAESEHQNVILKLAMRYALRDGDVINDDGTIKRKE